MKRIKGFCLLFLVLLCASCTDHIAYRSYHHFTKEGWSKSDTLLLPLYITDTIPGEFNIFFLVRNQPNYPFQDFSVTVLHNMPDTAHWKAYKTNFILANENGKWNGSGWGGLYQSSVPLGKVYISHPGEYTFKVVHQMNSEWLQGLNDIGIWIKKEIEVTP